MSPKFIKRLADPMVDALVETSWLYDEEYVKNWNADPVRDHRRYDALWFCERMKKLGLAVMDLEELVERKAKKANPKKRV
jgi:hypothetical protein